MDNFNLEACSAEHFAEGTNRGEKEIITAEGTSRSEKDIITAEGTNRGEKDIITAEGTSRGEKDIISDKARPVRLKCRGIGRETRPTY